MNEDYPVREKVFVLKDDESLGPFSIDEILVLLEKGTFRYDDVCLREGAEETERLRQILDWEESPRDKSSRKTQITQSFSEDQTEGEEAPVEESPRILYHGHRSIVTFPIPFLALFGGILGSIWLYPVGAAFMSVSVSVSIIALVYLSVMRYEKEYFITQKRVELVTGLFARSSKEVLIADLKAVNITCKGLTGMIGIGQVDFFTTGDLPEVSFPRAWAAKEIKSLVRKLQDAL